MAQSNYDIALGNLLSQIEEDKQRELEQNLYNRVKSGEQKYASADQSFSDFGQQDGYNERMAKQLMSNLSSYQDSDGNLNFTYYEPIYNNDYPPNSQLVDFKTDPFAQRYQQQYPRNNRYNPEFPFQGYFNGPNYNYNTDKQDYEDWLNELHFQNPEGRHYDQDIAKERRRAAIYGNRDQLRDFYQDMYTDRYEYDGNDVYQNRDELGLPYRDINRKRENNNSHTFNDILNLLNANSYKYQYVTDDDFFNDEEGSAIDDFNDAARALRYGYDINDIISEHPKAISLMQSKGLTLEDLYTYSQNNGWSNNIREQNRLYRGNDIAERTNKEYSRNVAKAIAHIDVPEDSFDAYMQDVAMLLADAPALGMSIADPVFLMEMGRSIDNIRNGDQDALDYVNLAFAAQIATGGKIKVASILEKIPGVKYITNAVREGVAASKLGKLKQVTDKAGELTDEARDFIYREIYGNDDIKTIGGRRIEQSIEASKTNEEISKLFPKAADKENSPKSLIEEGPRRFWDRQNRKVIEDVDNRLREKSVENLNPIKEETSDVAQKYIDSKLGERSEKIHNEATEKAIEELGIKEAEERVSQAEKSYNSAKGKKENAHRSGDEQKIKDADKLFKDAEKEKKQAIKERDLKLKKKEKLESKGVSKKETEEAKEQLLEDYKKAYEGVRSEVEVGRYSNKELRKELDGVLGSIQKNQEEFYKNPDNIRHAAAVISEYFNRDKSAATKLIDILKYNNINLNAANIPSVISSILEAGMVAGSLYVGLNGYETESQAERIGVNSAIGGTALVNSTLSGFSRKYRKSAARFLIDALLIAAGGSRALYRASKDNKKREDEYTGKTNDTGLTDAKDSKYTEEPTERPEINYESIIDDNFEIQIPQQ